MVTAVSSRDDRLWMAAPPAGPRTYGGPMRWEALFADLELQMEAAAARERASDVAELTRAEHAAVRLVDRLQAATGSAVVIRVRSGDVARGILGDVGATWVVVVDGAREHLVPLHAVVAIADLPLAAAPPADALVRRLGLGHALRAVARDRSVVRLVAGPVALQGRLEAVSADHLVLAAAPDGSGRPTGGTHVVTLAALDLLTRV